MSKKVTLPSNVKTAYGLLSYIRKLIVEEPLRYNQRELLHIEGKSTDSWGAPPTYPACGTVGCVAGWTTALLSPRAHAVVGVWEYAKKRLGLTQVQSDELFGSDAAGPYWATPSQSESHAARGAAHIASFQAKYRRQLQSTPLR